MANSNKTPVAEHYDEIINSYSENLKRLFENIICGIIKIDNEGCLIFDSLDESFFEYLEKKGKKYKLSSDSASKLYVYGVWQFISNHDDVWSNKIFLISYQIRPTRESLYHYIRGCLASKNVPLHEVVHFFASSKKIITKKKREEINLIWFLLAYICADLSLDDIKERKITDFVCDDINYSPNNPLITKFVNQFYNYDFVPYFEDKSKIYHHDCNCSSFYELLFVLIILCQES